VAGGGRLTGSGQPLFRSVRLGGRLGGALTGDAVARIVKKPIARAGLGRRDFSGHSLRSGFLSSAAEHGASIWKLRERSRHRSMDTRAGYVRSKNCFAGHAGAGFR
jgi:integrase